VFETEHKRAGEQGNMVQISIAVVGKHIEVIVWKDDEQVSEIYWSFQLDNAIQIARDLQKQFGGSIYRAIAGRKLWLPESSKA
jgi:hypothetical protein